MATVVTSKGREVIVGRMQGSTPTQAEPKNIGWGTNPNTLTAAVTDISPFAEASEARVAGTSSTQTTTTTNDTYQVTGTITAGGSKTIGEVFLADSASKPTAVDAVVTASGVIGSTSGTTVIVTTGANFSANQFIQIRTEVMKITSIASNTLTVTRAQNGTAAISTIAVADVVNGGNPPGQTNVTNGSVYLHGDFTGIALNLNDSVAFTVQTKYT